MPATGETLYLIDGYAALFRAFYAIRNPLYSRTTGEPTNAVLVFAQMLLKLYTSLHPDYVVVAWDAPGKTFRDALYAQYPQYAPPTEPVATPTETTPVEETTPTPLYKGTRRETPDDLHTQTPRVLQLLKVFGIPVIGVPGLEADDIIATLTTQVLASRSASPVRVRIATRDKDMEQLIGPHVSLFDIHTGAELDATGLWDKRGITPEQVVDYLSLTGDLVDNIPGVPGIGPKTAAKLLQQFGTLDKILDTPPGMPAPTGKVQSSLEQARPWLPISRRLVTLEANAPIAFDLETARARPLPLEALLQFCDEIGFISFKKQCLQLADA